MVSNNAQEEDSVLIRLSVMQPSNIDLPERRILLTESKATAQLGRSSSRPSLGLQPAVTNGWYNSPVMSRHHAELEADFTSETVGIRDSGSMHGTYLNKDKVVDNMSQPTRIRVGDELTLGMPVFRNREEFQPVLVRVDGMEFHEASRRPTTTPTRTFTVPDDCSTDDNEPFDETFDETMALVPDMNVTRNIDDDATAPVPVPESWTEACPPPAGDLAPEYNPAAGLSHQLDGAHDEFTPGDAPPQSAYFRVGEGQSLRSDAPSRDATLLCGCGDGPGPLDPTDDLTDTDDEGQGNDEVGEYDIDSLRDIETDNDPDIYHGDHGDESRSQSWNSFSSDSEDEHMEDESDLDEASSEGVAMFEEDSDDLGDEIGFDGTGHPHLVLDSEQQTVYETRAASMETGNNRAPTLPIPLQRLPPISSVIPLGPNDWMSHSHSNWGPRSPSPSDAVLLPRHCRADAIEGEKIQSDVRLDSFDQLVLEEKELAGEIAQIEAQDSFLKPEEVNPAAAVDNICGLTMGSDVNDDETYAQKSGKAEFFAARAFNKSIHDENLRLERTHAHAYSKTPEAGAQSSDFILTPHARGLVGERTGRDSSEFADPRYSNRMFDAATWSTFDPDAREPSSAYELHHLKQQIRAASPLKGVPWAPGNKLTQEHSKPTEHEMAADTDVDVAASTCVKPADVLPHNFEQLEQQTQDLDDQGASVQPTDKHAARKGKRKAAEISEESPQESSWARSLSEEHSKAALLSKAVQFPSLSAARPSSDQIPLPSPPPSPEEGANREQRPTKKIKKIAERVGYAALGGVSVGAMVLTSLIYTAPSFT